MATRTVNINEQNNIVKREAPKNMMQWIQSYETQIAKALPSVMTPERFTRIAMTAVTQNPELGKCTPGSFIGALLTAAQLGLEPNTPLGQAYLIPFNNGKTGQRECQFQLGYRGLIELAHRSGEIQSIEAHIVRGEDDFEYELGLEPRLYHKPAMCNRGEITWVYAVYRLVNGGFGFEVMSHEDVEKHRERYSKAKGFSPWKDSWEEMAKKTVIKKVLKYAPMKTDFVRAMVQEDTTLNFSADGDDYHIIQDNSSIEVDEEKIVEADVKVEENQQTIDSETGEIK